ncbi:hypothetical protein ABDD95_12045 [Mucilaginibacter sp. PAMB04274]|uniref:hypothetical protein n=1 Tax=Mucilaginibacter sp. PAMB04274 TaxID=3138568 RepID=UPI0031F63C35
MKGLVICLNILFATYGLSFAYGQNKTVPIKFEIYNDTFQTDVDTSVIAAFVTPVTPHAVKSFYNKLSTSSYESLITSLLAYKEKHQLNDWLYYQLIRRTAQQISAKSDNYARYTLYKWFLLSKSGYDARLAIANTKLIFYVYNNEDITDIPFFMIEGKKYMCLNYHDYPNADLHLEPPYPVKIEIPEASNSFSYEVTRMPDFKAESYFEKSLGFVYDHKTYNFNIKLNRQVDSIFTNYPGVDFKTYFNIPLTHQTYSSLIPLLRANTKGMNQKKGVDYLMRFTRYAFLYEDDAQNFGKEKRLSPEETLFNNYSDCDDRAGLFFYLVKELYNLPMIALLYPTHVTIAVQFDKPDKDAIMYNGKLYSVCEPTLQPEDLRIGQVSSKLKNTPYQVVYHYEPLQKGGAH